MSPGSHLGPYLGAPDPAHRRKWLEAQRAGRAAAPRCTAVLRSGLACRQFRMHGTALCRHHLKGVERDRVDNLRAQRLQHVATTGVEGPARAERARRALLSIEVRRLHRAWLLDPTVPGATLRVNDRDLREIDNLLLVEHGIDVESAQHTPRCRDRLRWASFLILRGQITPEAGRRRVHLALRDDQRWRDCQRDTR